MITNVEKRKDIINKIYKICKAWEDCKIEKRMAKEILETLEAEGMDIPRTFCKDCGVETKPGRGSARCHECWDSRLEK